MSDDPQGFEQATTKQEPQSKPPRRIWLKRISDTTVETIGYVEMPDNGKELPITIDEHIACVSERVAYVAKLISEGTITIP